MKKKIFACFAVVYFCAFLFADSYLSAGLDAYGKGDFSSAVLYLQKAIDASGGKNEDAQYWLTMALVSGKKYNEGLVEAKRFLALYPSSLKRPDMIYQKGRLECSSGDYEKAISTLYDFIKQHPKDKAVSSAYFWIGESLYNTGRFDEARTIFSVVVLDYPESAKIEAAKYKLALIDQASTQDELLRLLKLSNDETLRLSQELEKLKAQYEQLTSQAKNSQANAGDPVRIAELEQYLVDERRKNAELYDKLTLLQMKNDELSTMIANFANADYLNNPPVPQVQPSLVQTPPDKPEVTETASTGPTPEELQRQAALEELLRKAKILQGMYDEVLEEE